MSMTPSDVLQIAGALSGPFGLFPPSELVNYGQTILVKPGAATGDGVVLSGPQMASMLARYGYSVFPLAVEYEPSLASQLALFGSDETEIELEDLDADIDSDIDTELTELDVDVDADETGAYGKRGTRKEQRLKQKYLRVWGKFAKCKAMLTANKGYTPAGRYMLTLAFPFAALLTRKGKEGRLERRAKHCDKLQRHLLKVRQKLERKGYDVSDLPDPTDVTKALNIDREALVRPQARAPMTHLTRPVVTRRPAPPPYWRRRIVRRQFAPPPPAPRRYIPVTPEGQAVREGWIDPAYLADQAALEEQVSLSFPSYFGLLTEELKADLRAEADGYAFSDMEHDYYGIGGEVEVHFSDNEDLIGLDDEDDLMLELELDDDEELEGQEEGSPCCVGSACGSFSFDPESFDETDSDEVLSQAIAARTAGRMGQALNARRSELKKATSDAVQQAEIEKLDRVIAKRSFKGGVDYSRIVPRKKGQEGKPAAIVIAIRKIGPVQTQQSAIVQKAAAVGYYPREPGLIDVFAAAMYEAGQGYDDIEAMDALRRNVAPEDWYGAAFPGGEDAPLPAPRRIGREVY